MIRLLLVCLSVMLLIPNFITRDINEVPKYDYKEKYLPSLAYLNSVDKLEDCADNIASVRNIRKNSLDYFIITDSIISYRFYHGFSHYTLSENWIAAVGDKLLGHGLSNKVNPDDILKSQSAGCSQQALIMMSIAKRKKIDYRSIGFPHHYAMEVNERNWYYFDANMEPFIAKEQRNEQYWKESNDTLKQFYNPAVHTNLDYQFGIGLKPVLGSLNANPAPRLGVFHTVTFVLSKIAWIFPLLFAFALYRKKRPALITDRSGPGPADINFHPLLST